MKEPLEISAVLREAAERRKLKTPALARTAGVTYEVALRALKGTTVPREDTVAALALVLEIPEAQWRAALDATRQRRFGPPPAVTPRGEYLQRLIHEHEFLYPRGLAQTNRAVPVRLEEVYVSLVGESRVTLPGDGEGAEPEEADADPMTGPANPDAPSPEKLRPAVRESVEMLELAAVASRFPAVVITGPPGSGKTTLARFLCLLHARADLAGETQVTDRQGTEYGPAYLPVLFRVSRFAEQPASADMLEVLAGSLEPLSPHQSRELFVEALEEGRLLVLLDGLDEIVEGVDQARINAAIMRLWQRLREGGGNRLLITSRPQAYREERLPGLPRYSIRDMSRGQVERFLLSWCTAFEREARTPRPEQYGRREAEAVLRAVDANAGVRQLATNPLMCTLLALIHRNHTRLPERRVELLRVAVDTLARLWRAAQVEVPESVGARLSISEAEEAAVLRPLARWMHQHRDTGVIEEAELIRQVAALLARERGSDMSDPVLGAEVKEFLDRVRLHCGLLVERSDRRYTFMHLLFQEYLAGLDLVDDTARAVEEIRPLRHQPRWEEPLRLGIASKTRGDAGTLIRGGIRGQVAEGGRWVIRHPSPLEEWLHRDLLLACRAAGDCVALDPALSRELAEELLDVLLDVRQGLRLPALQQQISRTVQALWSQLPAEAVLSSVLLHRFEDENREIRRAAAEALAGVAGQEPVREALLRRLDDESWEVRETVVGALAGVAGQEPVREALLRRLDDESWDVRYAAELALGGVASQEPVRDTLLRRLDDENRRVREGVARALAGVAGQEPVREALLRRLDDESWEVRETVVGALAGVAGQEPVREALLRRLDDENSTVRSATAGALAGVVGQEPVREALLRRLDDMDEDGCRAVAGALAGAASQESVREALLRRLDDENSTVRSATAGALAGVVSQEPVREALLLRLKDENSMVRWATAGALAGAVSQEPVREALLLRLEDENSMVRYAVAGALAGVAGQEPVREALLRRLEDESWDIRYAVAGVLAGVVGQEPVREALLRRLEDESSMVRYAVAGALAGVAGQEPVREALLRHLEGPEESAWVANACWTALWAGAEATQSGVASNPVLKIDPDRK